MTCPPSGRHQDDRVSGHNADGLVWLCARCGRYDVRPPARHQPESENLTTDQPAALPGIFRTVPKLKNGAETVRWSEGEHT